MNLRIAKKVLNFSIEDWCFRKVFRHRGSTVLRAVKRLFKLKARQEARRRLPRERQSDVHCAVSVQPR